MESIASKIEKSPIVRIVDSITKLSIIVIVAMWLLEIDDRKEQKETERRQKIYTAWQVMSLSEFFDGTAAKKFAIEDLISENQPLDNLELEDEHLQNANFSKGSFVNVTFWDANLNKAKFIEATLHGASFLGAKLNGTDFQGASLDGCLFADTDLSNAINLTEEQIQQCIVLSDVALPKGVTLKNYSPSVELLAKWKKEYEGFEWFEEQLNRQFDTLFKKSNQTNSAGE